MLWPAYVAIALVIGGCNKGGSDSSVLKPKQAASTLEQAFGKANEEIKNTASLATDALRTADYEKAVVSLGVLRARPDLSVQQQMAVQESEATLTSMLVTAMDAGDAKAKQAYEMLKRSKRD